MTDRELLELAAKAAGYHIEENGQDVNGIPWYWCPELCDNWDPLFDDGDALRLAVKLNLLVDCASACARPLPDSIEWQEASGPDDYAATRRAIVRAAAEIGKEMK